MVGLNFKGFYFSSLDEPRVFNGQKFYNGTLTDGVQEYSVRLGNDKLGEVRASSIIVFDQLYDGDLKFNNGKLDLGHIAASSLKDPVVGLSFSGLRVSSIPTYVHENSEGIKYYSANFSDGVKPFTMSLGSGDEGLKLRDSLVVRSVLYEGTVEYIAFKRKDGDVKLLAIKSIKPVSKK